MMFFIFVVFFAHSIILAKSNGEVSCNTLIGYYSGVFRKNPQNFNDVFETQFQVKIELNNGLINFTLLNLNQTYEQAKETYFHLYSEGQKFCFQNSTTCTIALNGQKQQIGENRDKGFLQAHVHGSGLIFNLMYFKNISNKFILNNPIGQCTKDQIIDSDKLFHSDTTKFSYCLCCDKYDNNQEGCPLNPWVK